MGVVRRYHKTEDGFAIQHRQDVEPILNANAEQRNSGIRPKNFQRIASIPSVVWMQWMQDSGLPAAYWLQMPKGEMKHFVEMKLNDPDWKWLKTIDGRV